jgi:hypothetical protein
MENLKNSIIIFFIALFAAIEVKAQETVIVRPKEINDVMLNPGKGFTAFQCFNGDFEPYAKGGIQESGGRFVPDCYTEPVQYKINKNFININHPQTTVAYFRINWSFIEPEEGKYNWRFIDSLLVTGERRNQRLLLRIAPFSGSIESINRKDVPSWFRKKIGPTDKASVPHEFWFFDQNNPLYVKHFGDLIREFGKRYDGHPMIEAVDLSICSQAGEGVGSDLLEEDIRNELVKAYTDSFRKTSLIVLGRTDKTEQNVYYLSKKEGLNVGWRVDCLGDMFGFSDSFNHMFDYYPQAIAQGMKAQDAWEKAPIAFEACWTMKHWKEQGWDLDYIIDQSLKWHISTFNNKSSPVPEEWKDKVDNWIKRMGYRFVLRKFTYPKVAEQNSKLLFTSWWENKGVAPIYWEYTLAVRLKGEKGSWVLPTDANITGWLPGDIVYDDVVFIPSDIPSGTYDIQIGIVDCRSLIPKVNLAIEGRDTEGWYSLGQIGIKKSIFK